MHLELARAININLFVRVSKRHVFSANNPFILSLQVPRRLLLSWVHCLHKKQQHCDHSRNIPWVIPLLLCNGEWRLKAVIWRKTSFFSNSCKYNSNYDGLPECWANSRCNLASDWWHWTLRVAQICKGWDLTCIGADLGAQYSHQVSSDCHASLAPRPGYRRHLTAWRFIQNVSFQTATRTISSPVGVECGKDKK